MKDLIKISAKTYAKCQYHGLMEQKISCNYIACCGHSRLFEGGRMAYDPEYCDKYAEGEALRPFKDLTIGNMFHEEYADYKHTRIQKERSTYAYKHRKG